MIYLFTVNDDNTSYRYSGHYFYHNDVVINITDSQDEFELVFSIDGEIEYKEIRISMEYKLPSRSEQSYVYSINEDQALIDVLEREKLNKIFDEL